MRGIAWAFATFPLIADFQGTVRSPLAQRRKKAIRLSGLLDGVRFAVQPGFNGIAQLLQSKLTKRNSPAHLTPLSFAEYLSHFGVSNVQIGRLQRSRKPGLSFLACYRISYQSDPALVRSRFSQRCPFTVNLPRRARISQCRGVARRCFPPSCALQGCFFFLASLASPANRLNLSGTTRSGKPAMRAQKKNFPI